MTSNGLAALNVEAQLVVHLKREMRMMGQGTRNINRAGAGHQTMCRSFVKNSAWIELLEPSG